MTYNVSSGTLSLYTTTRIFFQKNTFFLVHAFVSCYLGVFLCVCVCDTACVSMGFFPPEVNIFIHLVFTTALFTSQPRRNSFVFDHN